MQKEGPQPSDLSQTETKYHKDYDPVANTVYDENPNRKLVSLEKIEKKPDANAKTTAVFTYGAMEIGIWEASASGTNPAVSVSVDPSFLCIGGGARTNSNQAYLKQSAPVAGGSTWAAISLSKSYVGTPLNHTLTVYVVGLRLRNMSGYIPLSTLKSYYTRVSAGSPVASVTYASVNVPAGYIVTGGGGSISYNNQPNYMVSSVSNFYNSYGINPTGWIAEGSDVNSAFPASIYAYAIGLKEYIPEFGTIKTLVSSLSPTTVSGNAASQTATNTTNYLISCPGAISFYNSNSKPRLFTELYPIGQAKQIATTEDGDQTLAGSITSHPVYITY